MPTSTSYSLMKQCACAVVLAFVPIWLFGAAPPTSNATSLASEREVKAAILYRVAKFIDWPADSFTNSTSPFVVCVVGDEEVLHAFDSLAGKTVNGHNVNVRRVTGDMLDLRLCHAAFFPADIGADVDYALSKLKGLPVLTVGEAEDFAYRGGILALLTRNQRVKFALNLPVSKSAGLVVSSQLLQLATVVGHAP
jgi:hypothetical protein